MTGQRTRSIALYLIAVIVVAGTVTAFIQSYEGLYEWARRYLSERWARTWPLQVDAWIAVGELTLYVASWRYQVLAFRSASKTKVSSSA